MGVLGLALLGLVRMIYDERDDTSWADLEKIAAQVDQVTPAGAPLYADEQIYFLTRRIPPSGNEYVSSHNLRLPPALAAAVKIVPQPEMDKQVASGEFATVETCEDDDWIAERKLDEIYKQKAESLQIARCTGTGRKKMMPRGSALRAPARHEIEKRNLATNYFVAFIRAGGLGAALLAALFGAFFLLLVSGLRESKRGGARDQSQAEHQGHNLLHRGVSPYDIGRLIAASSLNDAKPT